MKKRNQRLHDYQTMSKRILCGKFALRLHNNFACGDQQNNLLLYNVTTNKPISVLNSMASNVSSLTALTFTADDEQIVVGSNRGSMNIWDLNTLKIAYCLKGHTIQICSFYSDRKNPSLLASGSCDTNTKLWDIRAKQCMHTLKNHHGKVSALCIATDERLLASGGEDGAVFTYDIRMLRPVYTYEVDSPVLSIACNSQGMMAVGAVDRMARIFSIHPSFNLLGTTKPQTMPIAAVLFHQQQYLFTAGTDNMRIWDTSNEFTLTDNIQSSSKGILDMVIADKIQQIAYSGGSLSYHQCLISQCNFQGAYSYTNNSITVNQTIKRVQEGIEKNNSIKRGSSLVNKSIAHNSITNQKVKAVINKRSQSIAKQLSGVNENINDALTNIKKVTQQFNSRKNQTIQLRQLMGDDHRKFMGVMQARLKAIGSILQMWMKGNIKYLIQHLKTVDIYVVADVLAQILKPSKVQISAQFGVIIAERAKQMILSKHLTLIKSGLEYMLQVVTLFRDQMIKLKTFGMDKGVDLAREERLRRYDLLIEQYVEIYQSHRLKRLVEKKDQSSRMADQLSGELAKIFKKVFGNEYQV